jgi:hypothetical protein
MTPARMRTITWYALAAVACAAAAATVLSVLPAGAAGSVPYTDGQSAGSITLYDQAGHQITQGSITAHPFAYSAVSSMRAPAGYDKDGRKATLLAYQPREGANPAQWSGDTLTASTVYSDPAHPTATATAKDFSLKDYLDTYPTLWGGMVQLRIYLGAPDVPTYNDKYATADLRVDGDTWTMIRSGGQAPAANAAANAPGNGGSGTGSGSNGGNAATSGGSSTSDQASSGSTELPPTSTPGVLIEAAAALFGVVALGLVRRRRPATANSAPARELVGARAGAAKDSGSSTERPNA